MDADKQREAEIRKLVQQLSEKARVLIEATASESHLGMRLEQRKQALQDLKSVTETLLKEMIDVLNREGYEKNREMISFCFTKMTGIAERLDSALRVLKLRPTG